MREGDEQQLRTFDTATGEEVHAWSIQGSLVHISPDRARLASITLQRPQPNMEREATRMLTIWDAKTEQQLFSFALPSAEPRAIRPPLGAGGPVRPPRPTESPASAGLYFNRDGTRLIFRVADRLNPITYIIFDTVAGRRLCQVTLADSRRNVVELATGSDAPLLSPDGKRLVTHSNDKITIWDVETGQTLRTLRGHMERIDSLAITPDSRYLWSVDQAGTLKQWELNPPEPPVLTAGTNPRAGIMLGQTGLASSADGRWIAASAFPADSPAGILHVWNAETGGGAITFQWQHRDSEKPPAPASPQDQPRRSFPPARQVRMAAVAISDNAHRVALVESPPKGVSFSVEPTNLVAELTVWDVPKKKELFHAKLAEPGYVAIDTLAISPDGATVAVGVSDTDSFQGNVSIKLFASDTGEERRTINADSVLGGLRFSPDGRRLAAVTLSPDGMEVNHPTLSVWDVMTGEVLVARDLSDRSYSVYVVVWSPDGGRLAVGGTVDSSITVHDARTGQRLATIELPDRGDGVPRAQLKRLAFSPDGRRIASAHVSIPDRQAIVQLWDAATGKELLNLASSGVLPSLGPSESIHIAFSADCHRLLQFEPLQDSAFQSGGISRIRLTTWDATPRKER
jgi:WD40 repeat protein